MHITIRAAYRIAFFLTSLSCCTQAQIQVVTEPYRKWLDCDVDWIFSEATVGSNFSIKIAFHDAPVGETTLSLRKTGKIVATARTNSAGIAHFDRISEGKYWPTAPDGLLFPSSNLEIVVKSDSASGEIVKLDWPDHSIASRALRGRFSVSEDLSSPEVPLRNAAVELRHVYTAKLIESGQTDVNGDYEFATNDAGLYAVRLILPKKGKAGIESGDIAVELNPEAKAFSIPCMKVVQSDCAGVQLFSEITK